MGNFSAHFTQNNKTFNAATPLNEVIKKINVGNYLTLKKFVDKFDDGDPLAIAH